MKWLKYSCNRFAFAATDSVDEIDKAKRLMEGKEIEGRKLRVRSAKDAEKNIGKDFCGAKRRESAQKPVITREDTTKHLVQAFHDFLGRQLEGSRDDSEFRGEIESARTALAFAFSLPKDNSLKVSRKIEDTFYRLVHHVFVCLSFFMQCFHSQRDQRRDK